MEQPRHLQIPVWFFIGLILLADGLLIFGWGVYRLLRPEALGREVALGGLHADVWWGLLITALGLFYTFRFPPHKEPRDGGG